MALKDESDLHMAAKARRVGEQPPQSEEQMEHYQEDRTGAAGNQNKAPEKNKLEMRRLFQGHKAQKLGKTVIYLTTLFSCIFVGGCFWFAEAGSHSTAPPGLEFTMQSRPALGSWQTSCLTLPRTGIAGMHRHSKI